MSASSPASAGKDGAIAWARSLMGRTDWVILDTETTGLGSTDVVLQIGVTDHRGVTLVDTLVRPAVAIGSGAQAVHGISAEAVAAARDFPSVIPELVRAISGKTVVAYNAPFDRRLLDQTASRHRVALPTIKWDCAMQWYTRYLGVRSAKLPGAIHGATGDCLATLAVIHTMAGPDGGTAVAPAATSAPDAPGNPAAQIDGGAIIAGPRVTLLIGGAIITPESQRIVRTTVWSIVGGKRKGNLDVADLGTGEFSWPASVAVDWFGQVWVAEIGDRRILRKAPGGVWTVVGGYHGGADDTRRDGSDRPVDIALDEIGDIWMANSVTHRIERRDSVGRWLLVGGRLGARLEAQGTGLGEFNGPFGIAIDRSGAAWVADTFNHRIQRKMRGGRWQVLGGRPGGGDGARGSGPGEFDGPTGIAVDRSGAVWVSDSWNNRIQMMTSAGEWQVMGGRAGGGDNARGSDPGEFNGPAGISIDAGGTVWVADSGNHRIQRMSRAGHWEVIGGCLRGADCVTGTGPGEFNEPRGIATDLMGAVWVADTNNHRIQRFGMYQRAG